MEGAVPCSTSSQTCTADSYPPPPPLRKVRTAFIQTSPLLPQLLPCPCDVSRPLSHGAQSFRYRPSIRDREGSAFIPRPLPSLPDAKNPLHGQLEAHPPPHIVATAPCTARACTCFWNKEHKSLRQCSVRGSSFGCGCLLLLHDTHTTCCRLLYGLQWL